MMQTLYGPHVAELQRSWEKVLDESGFSAVFIHSGNPIESFLDDYVYPFRPNPHFLAWLPLTHHPDCVLVIRPGRLPKLWYYQPDDYWHVPPANPDSWWSEHFELQVTTDKHSWKADIEKAGSNAAGLGDSVALISELVPERINPRHLIMRLHLLRTRKSGYELACMREATRRAVTAHLASRDAFLAGRSEYDIHLAYLDSVRQNDAELPYKSIVALNEHAAVLHYQQRDMRAPAESRSFLIDAGACCHAYAADITRTYSSAPGAFADLIQAMEKVELNLAGQAVSGQSYPQLHLQAHHQIAGVLKEAGIVQMSPEGAVESGLTRVFFPHGLGHFIGLQTHDVAGLVDNDGMDLDRPAGHPWLRLTRTLEAGNVLTIEPGLYFIPSLLSQWREQGDRNAINWTMVEKFLPFGGIRIEDNVVVGDGSVENLTRQAFASATAD